MTQNKTQQVMEHVTENNTEIAARLVADFTQNIADNNAWLETVKDDAKQYVLFCGGLVVTTNDNNTRTHVCNVKLAKRFGAKQAWFLASRITNGRGEKAQAITVQDAVARLNSSLLSCIEAINNKMAEKTLDETLRETK